MSFVAFAGFCKTFWLRLCVKKEDLAFWDENEKFKNPILENQQLATLILGRSFHFGCSKSRMHPNALQCTGGSKPPGSLRKVAQAYASQKELSHNPIIHLSVQYPAHPIRLVAGIPV